MYRRLISGCVLAGFVVAQWAAMPHGHAPGTQLPPNHSARPHVHLASVENSPHKHEHGHTHGSGRGHHHESPTGDCDKSPDECGVGSTADHDEDAVYLPTVVSITATGGTHQCKLLTAPAILHFVNGASFTSGPSACQFASLQLSDEHAPGCALWLALRTLRI